MRSASTVVAVATTALLGVVGPADARLLAFKSPSGNITCVMSTESGGFAQCEVRSKRRGGGLSVSRRGKVTRYDVGDDDLAERRFVLGYGRSRSLDVFTCTSRMAGMTCRNRRNGHGFTTSRQRQRIF